MAKPIEHYKSAPRVMFTLELRRISRALRPARVNGGRGCSLAVRVLKRIVCATSYVVAVDEKEASARAKASVLFLSSLCSITGNKEQEFGCQFYVGYSGKAVDSAINHNRHFRVFCLGDTQSLRPSLSQGFANDPRHKVRVAWTCTFRPTLNL